MEYLLIREKWRPFRQPKPLIKQDLKNFFGNNWFSSEEDCQVAQTPDQAGPKELLW